jgi:mRNA-degrading endonuclease YafQ of YafQ-DinJ toxin-antitoxin module
MTVGPVKIEFDPAFSRRVKKLNPQLKQKLVSLSVLFSQNPFHPRLKTHKLKGVLKNRYAFSLTPSVRVIFRFVEENTALFLAIGTHDQVYS